MTDDADVCGYPTAGGDGDPCRNPTTDDDNPERCWIPSHSDSDAENPQGRKFTLGADDHDAILEAARMGASKAGCARAAGTNRTSLERYLEAHDKFRAAFAQARAQGEQRLLEGPLWNEQDAPREMDGQHARFLLSTSFDYIKTEKKELEDVTEGSDGFGTTVVLDSEYVDSE